PGVGAAWRAWARAGMAGGGGRRGPRPDLTRTRAFLARETRAKFPTAAPTPPPAASMDVYFGAVFPPGVGPAVGCPRGDAVVFATEGFTGVHLACLSSDPRAFRPVVQNAAGSMLLPTLSFVWTREFPAGSYTFFVALPLPGAFPNGVVDAGGVLAVSTATVVFAP